MMTSEFFSHKMEWGWVKVKKKRWCRIQVGFFQMFSAKVSFPMNTTNQVWIHVEDNVTMYVNGLGASVEVIEPNIGATNGVIHIIDKVLGVPTQNTYSALKKDPMLRWKWKWKQKCLLWPTVSFFQFQWFILIGKSRPSEWSPARRERGVYLSRPLQLGLGRGEETLCLCSQAALHGLLWVSGESWHLRRQNETWNRNTFQSKAIMEKHLKIGQKLSIDDLLRITNDEGGVQMFRGNPLKFEHIDGGLYFHFQLFSAVPKIAESWQISMCNGKISRPRSSDPTSTAPMASFTSLTRSWWNVGTSRFHLLQHLCQQCLQFLWPLFSLFVLFYDTH